jgi:hypothetical protein
MTIPNILDNIIPEKRTNHQIINCSTIIKYHFQYLRVFFLVSSNIINLRLLRHLKKHNMSVPCWDRHSNTRPCVVCCRVERDSSQPVNCSAWPRPVPTSTRLHCLGGFVFIGLKSVIPYVCMYIYTYSYVYIVTYIYIYQLYIYIINYIYLI